MRTPEGSIRRTPDKLPLTYAGFSGAGLDGPGWRLRLLHRSEFRPLGEPGALDAAALFDRSGHRRGDGRGRPRAVSGFARQLSRGSRPGRIGRRGTRSEFDCRSLARHHPVQRRQLSGLQVCPRWGPFNSCGCSLESALNGAAVGRHELLSFAVLARNAGERPITVTVQVMYDRGAHAGAGLTEGERRRFRSLQDRARHEFAASGIRFDVRELEGAYLRRQGYSEIPSGFLARGAINLFVTEALGYNIDRDRTGGCSMGPVPPSRRSGGDPFY